MKSRILIILFAIVFSVTAFSCSGDLSIGSLDSIISESQSSQNSQSDSSLEKPSDSSGKNDSSDNNLQEESVMYIKVNKTVLEVDLEKNSSSAALMELLKKGDITIDMSDYGNMEKVGSLGTSLPRNDKQISVSAGDVILYQGNMLTIYYSTNSWSFTRLGKIRGYNGTQLKALLGSGSVIITLSAKL